MAATTIEKCEEYSRNDSEFEYRRNDAHEYGQSRPITDRYESHSRRGDSSTRATTNVEVESYAGFSKLSLENTEVSTSNEGNRSTYRLSRVCEEDSERYPCYDGGSRYASGYQRRAVNDYSSSRTSEGFGSYEDDSTRTTVNVKVKVEVDNDGQTRGVYGPSAFEGRHAYSRRTYESDSNFRNYSSH
jgi:hypothetical protein